jgi:PIN domain nuclease of toxin-antitoxin system
VRLVTDTHALVWYVSGEHRRLSRRAHAVFRQAEQGRSTVIIPTVVLFELTLLERIGRIRVAYEPMRQQLALRPGFELAELTVEDVDGSRALHGLADPFDRLIVATARRLGTRVLTRDRAITEADAVPTYW